MINTSLTLAVPEEGGEEFEEAVVQWKKIIDDLDLIITEEGIPDKIAQFIEYNIGGLSIRETAKRIGITTATCREWLVKYPEIGEIIKEAQKKMRHWRMAQIEKAFGDSIRVYERILTGDFPTPDPKLLTVQQKTARHIIDLLTGGGKTQIPMAPAGTTINQTLVATPDALDYISKRYAEIANPIVAKFNELTIEPEQPLLDEQGNPFYGKIGAFDRNETGTQCHICGNYYKNLASHITGKHKIKLTAYNQTFVVNVNRNKNEIG